MGKKIRIEKVLLFDDNEIKDEKDYVSQISRIMERSFSKAKTLSNFALKKNFSVESYFLNEDYTGGLMCTLERTEEYDWYEHLDDIFEDGKGYLVLCDFGWHKGEFAHVRDEIYRHVKNKKEVVFVCYTATIPDAETWLERILDDKHECKIMDILLTVPKKLDGRIRSIEEAIIDEW